MPTWTSRAPADRRRPAQRRAARRSSLPTTRRTAASERARSRALTAQPPTPRSPPKWPRFAEPARGSRRCDAAQELVADRIPPASRSAPALSYLGMMIREKAYADHRYTPEQQAERDGFGMLDLPQVVAALQAAAARRHLGDRRRSCTTARCRRFTTCCRRSSDRPKTFRVGSREFDTGEARSCSRSARRLLGVRHGEGRQSQHRPRVQCAATRSGRKATRPRRACIGPLLSHEDRLAIIEHLKVRNDDLDGDPEPHVPGYPYSSVRSRRLDPSRERCGSD